MPAQFILQNLFKESIQPVSKEQIEELVGLTEQLPGEYRIATRLYLIEKLARKDIARKLDWPLSKVHTKITRGISLLKRELENKMATSLQQTT